MTVSVAWVGDGRQFTANDASDTVVVIKYAGSGGTPPSDAGDGAKEGSDSITITVSKQGNGLFVELPTALDFTGTEADQLVYVWGNFLAAALLLTQANAGFGICMSSGLPTASNYSLWSFFGNENYQGGWKRMVVDPTKTRTAGAGTFDSTNVTHIGVFADVGGTTARFDNLLLDACDVGTGLKITGNSTLGLIEELLANEEINRYGVITSLNDTNTAVELSGTLTLGDDSGTTVSIITDEDSKIFVAEPLYYNGGIIAAVPVDYTSLNIVGNATGDTDVNFGIAVGSDQGRNGITLVGNPTYNVGIDRDDGNVEAAAMCGCSFENLTGIINLDGIHSFLGNSFSSCSGAQIADGSEVRTTAFVICGEINLKASGKVIDILVINSTADQSILTSNLNDVEANLTSDGFNHAVKLTSIGGGSMSWKCVTTDYDAGLTGSPVTPTSTGNEDIYVAVGSGTLTINVEAGATIPSIRSDGAIVNVVAGQVPITITVLDKDTGAPIELAHVLILKDSDKSELLNGATNASGVATTNVTYIGDFGVLGWARQMDISGIDYHPEDISGELTAAGFLLTVSLRPIV